MKRNWIVRRATSDDVDALADIWYEGWRDGHLGHVSEPLAADRTRSSFPERVRSRLASTLVCAARETVTGFVVVIDDEIEQVHVDRAWRGNGIARKLLSAALLRIAQHGHARAWLAVIPQNQRARAVCEDAGWRDDGEIDYRAETSNGSEVVTCRRYVIDV